MKTATDTINSKIFLLKESRLKLLRLHKLLVDTERKNFENRNGKISSGQFLNLLINDPNFEWLRRFSTLIVEIDEMLDLDDGYTIEMIDKYLRQIRALLDSKTEDEDFNGKFMNYLEVDSEAAEKQKEILKLISE